jgi:hypothetical protein
MRLLSSTAHASIPALVLAGAVSALGSACTYDIDKIYKHPVITPEAGPPEVPEHLIDLWSDGTLADECRSCARQKCGGAINGACRDDAECLAFTGCMASATNPADMNDCRAQHTEWLREDIRGRDMGGPYHTCVFLNECVRECDSQRDLACASDGYQWPKANADSVWLHLQLLEGLESNPAPDVRVRACKSVVATECEPASKGWATSDERGVVDLEVTLQLGSFVGYLELEGGGLYPTLMRFGWPIARDLATKLTVVSDGNARVIINSITPPVPTPGEVTQSRGFIQARAFACNGIPAVGVSFETDAADMYTQDWYTPGQEIFPSFTETATSALGAGGITNVPPGRRSVIAKSNGEQIATFNTPVRAGYMSIVMVFPGVDM